MVRKTAGEREKRKALDKGLKAMFRTQGIVLLGIFLRVTPFQAELALSEEEVFRGVEKSLRKYFGKRGERVVQDNLQAVRRGFHEVIEVPRDVMLSTAQADQANAALRVV